MIAETKKNHVALSVLVGLVFAAFIFHLVNFGWASSTVSKLQNSLHAPGFGILAIVSMICARRFASPAMSYWLAAGFSTLIGVILELWQINGPRDADIGDLGRNIIGIGSFLAIAATLDKTTTFAKIPQKKTRLMIVVLPITAAILLAPVWYFYVIVSKLTAAPAIVTFESLWEREIYRSIGDSTISIVDAPSNWPVGGNHVVTISPGPKRYSGIVIEPFADWSGYEVLSFMLACDCNSDTDIYVRIDDNRTNYAYADRFNLRINAVADPMNIRIPVINIQNAPTSRKMNLSSVAAIRIFMVSALPKQRIFLDDLRLEKKHDQLRPEGMIDQ